MSDVVIRVEQLGKKYTIGHAAQRERYTALRDVLARRLRTAIRKTRDLVRGRPMIEGDELEEMWALRDVSFEVKRSEVIGVIGRNGAGKSTLLKILSRITEPSEGRVAINGRVASLLEVGTGFHAELTGRENIFLNGAILGMSREEIRRKFDEIVAFAEVEKYLDTQVKRYSSGMYVRLAFAVAAHLESEILIVDEVLAVGDIQFQKKCLGKMSAVAQSGRTVLFVSHNMTAVEQLTSRCLLLDHGSIQVNADAETAIACYEGDARLREQVVYEVGSAPRKYGNLAAKIQRLEFDRRVPEFRSDEDLTFLLTYLVKEEIPFLRVSMAVLSADGTPVGSAFSEELPGASAGVSGCLNVSLARPHLAPGHYYCGVAIGKGNHLTGHVDYDVVLETLHFRVSPPQGDSGTLVSWPPAWGRVMFPELSIVDNVASKCPG